MVMTDMTTGPRNAAQPGCLDQMHASMQEHLQDHIQEHLQDHIQERTQTQRQDHAPPLEPNPFRLPDWAAWWQQRAPLIQRVSAVVKFGRVQSVVGALVRASVPGARMGELCRLSEPAESGPCAAVATGVNTDDAAAARSSAYPLCWVVGFSGESALLMPMGELDRVSTRTLVQATGAVFSLRPHASMCGRVLSGLGRPLDDKGDLVEGDGAYSVIRDAPNPMTRRTDAAPFLTGLRAIDGVLTCVRGQRVGIFAAAGGGKSTLLGMIAKGAAADVIVVALIGERGREVRDFIERVLGPDLMTRTVIVCATSDRSAMERVSAAYVATTIAEYFRAQGGNVLLVMDSLTRFARAQREIALAAGEPAARRGFPPSVFARLPQLIERAGADATGGAITAFYTVLVEGDDMTEPVADEARSLLDGHLVLSAKLAAQGHYPAIDVPASASRMMGLVAGYRQRQASRRLRAILTRYDNLELLIRMGEYQKGVDPADDEAVERRADVLSFLQQERVEPSDLKKTVSALAAAVGDITE